MRVLIAKFTPIAKFSSQDAQRHARSCASKNINSQKRQTTESQDRKDNKSKESQNNQPGDHDAS